MEVSRQLTFYDFEGFRELCHFFDQVHEDLADMYESLKRPRALIKLELTSYIGNDHILEIEIKDDRDEDP